MFVLLHKTNLKDNSKLWAKIKEKKNSCILRSPILYRPKFLECLIYISNMFTVYKYKVISHSEKQYARSRKVRARVKRKLKRRMNPIKPPKPIQYHFDSAKIPRLFKNVVPIRSPLTI
jgi:hypothetical protein